MQSVNLSANCQNNRTYLYTISSSW